MALLSRKAQKNTAFTFGAIFIGLILAIAILFPNPTDFQYTVFRVVLALAAAGVASVMPGLLNANWHGAVTASGALAVFAVVYFFSPAVLQKDDTSAADETPAAAPTESAAWADIEATLEEKPDPVAEQTRKDLEATKLTPNFEDAPLDEAARYLSGLSSHVVAVVPGTWEVFSEEELWVTAKSEEITLVETLDLICAEKQLAWWIDGKTVKIAPSPPRTEVVTITFPIENLTTGENPYQPDAIADMIRDQIDQDVWDEDGEVQYQGPGKGLLVTAPKATQKKVLALLRDLLER